MHGGRELIAGENDMVNTDRVKGKINEAGGGVRRDLGEWTGDTNMQMEGLTQEVKGKAQKTWGDVKDAVRDARNEVKRKPAGRKAGDSRAE
jgi:uncharacterized protein YjbJ (UPF0337 family)